MNTRQELLEIQPNLNLEELNNAISLTVRDAGYSEEKLLKMCLLGIRLYDGDAVEFMRDVYRQLKKKKHEKNKE